MKIIRQISAGVAIVSIGFLNIEKSTANPAVLAPAAICAGTAGVGCIVIGTIMVGGTIYYIWQLSNGQKVKADARGRVLHSEYLEDPEAEHNASGRPGDSGIWEEPIYAKTYASAREQCKQKARRYGAVLVEFPYDPKTKQYRCSFRGSKHG